MLIDSANKFITVGKQGSKTLIIFKVFPAVLIMVYLFIYHEILYVIIYVNSHFVCISWLYASNLVIYHIN